MKICVTQPCPGRDCKKDVVLFIEEAGMPPPLTWFQFICPFCNIEAVFSLGSFSVVQDIPALAVIARRLLPA